MEGMFNILRLNRLALRRWQCRWKCTTASPIQVSYEDQNVKGRFSITLPGWSSTDCRHQLLPVSEGWFLKPWRFLLTLERIRDIARRSDFLNLEKLNKTHMTFFRCTDVERLVSLRKLQSMGYYPYSYPISVNFGLARLGISSFQLEAVAVNAETQDPLFRSAIVVVCVERNSRRVAPLPEWWVKLYQPLFTDAHPGPLRVDLRADKAILLEGKILSTSRHQVLATDIDYYKHTNYSAYHEYASDALLEAFIHNRLPDIKSVKQLEGGVKKIDAEWTSDSLYGDTLEAFITADTDDRHKLICRLYKSDILVYSSSWLFEEADDQWLATSGVDVTKPAFPFSMTVARDAITASVSGWEMEDMSMHMSDFGEAVFLRIWRVIMTRQWLWVIGMENCFGDFVELEKVCMMYVKSVVLERLVPLEVLKQLQGAHNGPYPYGIDVKFNMSKVGQKSGAFQTTVSTSDTGENLFLLTLTIVSVDKDGRKPIPMPEWWRNKYAPLAKDTGSDSHVVNVKSVRPVSGVLSVSHHVVRASCIDYYRHANNTTYQVIAAEALVAACDKGQLPSRFATLDIVEGAVRRLEAEFIGPCDLGDMVEAQIFMDASHSNMLYCNLINHGQLIYAQRWVYDENDTHSNNMPELKKEPAKL